MTKPTIGLSVLARALAMDPDAARRACEESLAYGVIARRRPVPAPEPLGVVLPFAPPPADKLDQVAHIYLRTPNAPNGLAKSLSALHGVDYGQLLQRIGVLRHSHRFA
jgi:hypothetical protein